MKQGGGGELVSSREKGNESRIKIVKVLVFNAEKPNILDNEFIKKIIEEGLIDT